MWPGWRTILHWPTVGSIHCIVFTFLCLVSSFGFRFCTEKYFSKMLKKHQDTKISKPSGISQKNKNTDMHSCTHLEKTVRLFLQELYTQLKKRQTWFVTLHRNKHSLLDLFCKDIFYNTVSVWMLAAVMDWVTTGWLTLWNDDKLVQKKVKKDVRFR